jgi:hypothetical protein
VSSAMPLIIQLRWRWFSSCLASCRSTQVGHFHLNGPKQTEKSVVHFGVFSGDLESVAEY